MPRKNNICQLKKEGKKQQKLYKMKVYILLLLLLLHLFPVQIAKLQQRNERTNENLDFCTYDFSKTFPPSPFATRLPFCSILTASFESLTKLIKTIKNIHALRIRIIFLHNNWLIVFKSPLLLH